uniref:Uncharacterized protein n=1 Tax=Tanacetum cinerariifolium TaxID=118510 RepID=A0A699HGD3_TANCI|nr:hypothetical protein [Tanacetum cinerariifolium]
MACNGQTVVHVTSHELEASSSSHVYHPKSFTVCLFPHLVDPPMQKIKLQVKENQEKDKIGSKPDKNGKRVKAGKSLKQLQWIKEEKPKKTQKNGQKRKRSQKLFKYLKNEEKKGARNAILPKYQPQGPNLPTAHTCTP